MSLDTANSLVTLPEAKKYLGMTTEASTWDERIEGFIDEVSGMCNAHTGRKLKARELTEYYDGDGSTLLMVDEYPINSGTTGTDIYVDTTWEYSTDTKINSTSMLIYDDKGKIVLKGNSFTKGVRSVKITYNAGYTTSEMPNDLKNTVLKLVKYNFTKWRYDVEDVKNDRMGDYSASYDGEYETSVLSNLDKYRDVRY
jgi:hypothetical protein